MMRATSPLNAEYIFGECTRRIAANPPSDPAWCQPLTAAPRLPPQEQQQDEERYSRINRHKVQNQWRKLMRIAKVSMPALGQSGCSALSHLSFRNFPGRGADKRGRDPLPEPRARDRPQGGLPPLLQHTHSSTGSRPNPNPDGAAAIISRTPSSKCWTETSRRPTSSIRWHCGLTSRTWTSWSSCSGRGSWLWNSK